MKITVLSHYWFDETMKRMNLNDDNVEDTNMGFISIIGTPECLTYYLDEGNTKHFFKDHSNVLNLDFDDIENDVMYHGHHFKTMRMEQAERVINFIEKMIEKGVDDIYIHCRAGVSRSRAVGEMIYIYCKENDINVEYADRNDYTTMLNSGVLRKLKHAYWKKNKLNMYAEGETDYPNDLINVPLVPISLHI